MRIVSILGLVAACLAAAACTSAAPPAPATASPSATTGAGVSAVGMANPASVNCVKLGGKLRIVSTPAGQTGICKLPSGKECEEWALMRGECSPN